MTRFRAVATAGLLLLCAGLSGCSSSASANDAGQQAADLRACQAAGRLSLKLSDTSLSDADLVPLAQEAVDHAASGSGAIRSLADEVLAGTKRGAESGYFGDYTVAMYDMLKACRPITSAQGR